MARFDACQMIESLKYHRQKYSIDKSTCEKIMIPINRIQIWKSIEDK